MATNSYYLEPFWRDIQCKLFIKMKVALSLILTHVVKPESNPTVDAVKSWDDESKKDLWKVAQEREVWLSSDDAVPPLLKNNNMFLSLL